MLPMQPPSEEVPDPNNFTAALLAAVFGKVSQSISGPNRLSFDSEEEAQPFMPDPGYLGDALDPDAMPSEMSEFVPDYAATMVGTLPDSGSDMEAYAGRPFDASSLPDPGEGKFYTTAKGLVRYSIGVGEAPDNKANTNHPAFQQRNQFMAQVYDYVRANFDVVGAGHGRDHDAPVTDNRSPNSDHYSGGAFDVRAGSTEEAKRVLIWASQQPWVSFAQVYPDGKLVHISANIAAFTGFDPIPFGTPAVQPDPGTRTGSSGILPGSRPQPSPAPPAQPRPPTRHPGAGGVQEF